MILYPKNRIYAIIPIAEVKNLIGNFLSVACKSIDQNFIVWDFPADAKILEKLKKDVDIKLYSHDEILKIMSIDKWSRPLDLAVQNKL